MNQAGIEESRSSELQCVVNTLDSNALQAITCQRRSIAFAALTVLLAACSPCSPKSSTVLQSAMQSDALNSCTVDKATIEKEKVVNMTPSEIKVYDGDTLNDGKETYRFFAIDAAECAACFEDKTGWIDQYGVDQHSHVNYCKKGKEYVDIVIHTAKRIQKIMGGDDKYGRRLAYFIVDGKLLQCLLVRDGLAYEVISYYGPGDHPNFAKMVLDAAEYAGKPHFIPPYQYRKTKGPIQECQ